MLTVVCGPRSVPRPGTAGAEAGKSSRISPLLSRTLQSNIRQLVHWLHLSHYLPDWGTQEGQTLYNLLHELMRHLLRTAGRSYLGYAGPQSTSQQFLMMFLWLYGFWTLFFPDQEPLIWSKPKENRWLLELKHQTVQNHILPRSLLGPPFPELIQKHSSILRCCSHRLSCDLKRILSGIQWFLV